VKGMELAVLDLGSTTFHLQHFHVAGSGGLTSTLDLKDCTSLGAKVFPSGYIDAQTRAHALAVVDQLLSASNHRGFTQRAIVATSAIRSARNGRSLTRAIEARHDCPVAILEPHEEARLAYLGQLGSPEVVGKRFAMVDLGGGSVELSVGRDQQPLFTDRLPLGASRMRVAAADSCDRSALLREQLREPLRALARFDPELVVFGSGSARAARKLLLRASARPGKTGPINRDEFRSQLLALADHPPAQLVALGVEPARASTVLTAAAIMLQILELLGVQQAFVSDRGLRHGVASELLRHLTRQSAVFPCVAAPSDQAGTRDVLVEVS
jgi:exopolyphosphatase/guanosine-5'-triphosphate,3'-diphosphate pyrophosphatase